MLYVLNAPVLTNYGNYRFRKIDVEEARMLLESGFVSAVGHEGTARVLSSIVDISIPQNRITIRMKPGDKAIVLWLLERPPEGEVLDSIELSCQPFKLGLLERIG
jgi:hypothetical protein